MVRASRSGCLYGLWSPGTLLTSAQGDDRHGSDSFSVSPMRNRRAVQPRRDAFFDLDRKNSSPSSTYRERWTGLPVDGSYVGADHLPAQTRGIVMKARSL